jgi:hypothetical protein
MLLRTKACLLAVTSAKRYLAFQKTAAPALGLDIASNDNTAYVVRNAFWLSLLAVVVSCIAGAVAGATAADIFGGAGSTLTSVLQGVAALLLLWGTLFVRGWEIQSYGGSTLIERVDLWVFRALYCVGTGLLVASLVWAQR